MQEIRVDKTQYEFDKAINTTFLGRVNDKHIYSCYFSEDWRIGEVPHGGYIVSTALHAFLQFFMPRSQPHPVALNTFFLAKSAAGSAIIEISDLKPGKGYSVAQASIRQQKVPSTKQIQNLHDYDPSTFTETVHLIGTFGNMLKEQGVTNILNPTEVPSRTTFSKSNLPFAGVSLDLHVKLQTDKSSSPSEDLEKPGYPELKQSMEFADGRKPDLVSIPFLCDLFWPPPGLLGIKRLGGSCWYPTMQLEVQFKGIPRGKDVIGKFQVRYLMNGRNELDGEVWDEDGTLLALTRHQCLVVPWERNSKVLPKGTRL